MKTNISYNFFMLVLSLILLLLVSSAHANTTPAIMTGYCKNAADHKSDIITNMKFYQNGEVRMTSAPHGALDYDRIKHTDDADTVRNLISMAKAEFISKGGAIGKSIIDSDTSKIIGASFPASSNMLSITLRRTPSQNMTPDTEIKEDWQYIISMGSDDQRTIDLVCKIVMYTVKAEPGSSSNQKVKPSDEKTGE